MKKSRKLLANAPKTKRRSNAWPEFQGRLAEALSLLSEDQFLIINQKKTNRFVQFSAQGSFGFRAETVSNAFLSGADRIRQKEHDALLALGWGKPTGAPDDATPDLDPDGSPNYFVDFPSEFPIAVAAELAVKTLADVILVPHPANLEYRAFDVDDNEIGLESLGLKRTKVFRRQDTLEEKLIAAVVAATGLNDLAYDDDGDLGICHGELAVFITILGEPPFIRMYSPVHLGATTDLALLSRLNHLNCGVDHITYFVRDGAVFAVRDFPAHLLTHELVRDSLHHFFRRMEEVTVEFFSSAAAGGFLLGPVETTTLQ